MKSRVIQLCINVSTWSIVAILGLEHIQVKREIVRIEIEIHREASEIKQRTCTRSCDSIS